MKYVFILSVVINVAYAQTGIKTSPSPTEKRVLICCGKATNITSAPNATIKSNPSKPSSIQKQ